MLSSQGRRLVTFRTIKEIRPIDGADRIELAIVDGWQVVVGKGEFEPGDTAIYFEIDSAINVDQSPRFEFLKKLGVKAFSDGICRHVLRTAKIRGVLSQGLLIPVPPYISDSDADNLDWIFDTIKWEPPIPNDGKVVASFPSFLPKTDCERVQNLSPDFLATASDFYYPTEKIDGQSVTIWTAGGVARFASRNWEVSSQSRIAQVSDKIGLTDKLLALGDGFAIQGELYGPGIQGNPLGVDENDIAIFAVWFQPSFACAWRRLDAYMWPAALKGHGVPEYLSHAAPLRTADEYLADAERRSSVLGSTQKAEGVVWWAKNLAANPDIPCFKVVANSGLLKGN